MLNLSEIHAFAVAAETENFTKAARRLHLSQSAISQQIRSLETYLGIPLFQRSGRSVYLTDAGRTLLPMAQQVLRLTQQIEETMQSLQQEVFGHIVIGCTTTAGKYILPLIVAAFRQRYPNVQVTIENCSDGPVLDLLTNQQVHLGVSSTQIAHPDVECQPFFVDQVVMVVPADHQLTHRSCVHPSDLLGIPFILREPKSSTYLMLQQALAEHGVPIDQLQVVMVVGNEEAIEAAVEYGLGAAFISRLAARHGLVSGNLVQVPIEGVCLERLLYVARSAHSPKTEAQVRLWDFVAKCRADISQMLICNPSCDRYVGLQPTLPEQPAASPR